MKYLTFDFDELFFKEIKHKKSTNDELKELESIEKSCCKTMEIAIDRINHCCTPLVKTLSPNVSNLQMHLNMFEDKNQEDIKLHFGGLVNYNLCMNAETQHAHTECDSSYTVICVPNQTLSKAKNGFKNRGSFELIINSNSTIVIPMTIGTIFTYSGYLLTHRQQIQNKSATDKPFINIVSYSSKRLFENMMESFRRYLDED